MNSDLFGNPVSSPASKKAQDTTPVSSNTRIALLVDNDRKKYYRLYVRPQIMTITPTPHKLTRLIKQTEKRTKTIEGNLSANASRKLKNVIRWLIASSEWKHTYEKKHKGKVPWKINMITLTFHENMIDDNLARQLLSKWLEMAKYRWEMHLYIWKAEPQSRGAIHFHISTNTYIPHTEVKYTWNRLLKKHGLNEMHDNSTDVHAVINCKSHENYLSDYFLNDKKHEGRRKIKGKLWGCSHALSQAGKDFITMEEHEMKALEYDNLNISLIMKYIVEHKQVPEWCKFADTYLTGEQFYANLPECDLKTLYFSEITKLRYKKKQLSFGF